MGYIRNSEPFRIWPDLPLLVLTVIGIGGVLYAFAFGLGFMLFEASRP